MGKIKVNPSGLLRKLVKNKKDRDAIMKEIFPNEPKPKPKSKKGPKFE